MLSTVQLLTWGPHISSTGSPQVSRSGCAVDLSARMRQKGLQGHAQNLVLSKRHHTIYMIQKMYC